MKKEKINKNIIFELILGIVISLLIMMLGSNSYLVLLYPIPFIVIGIKYRLYYSLVALLVSLTIYSALTNIIVGLQLLILFLPMIISIIFTINNRKKPYQIILMASLIFLLSLVLSFGLISDLSGVNILTELENQLNEFSRLQLESLSELDLTNLQFINLRDQLEEVLEYTILLLPSLTIIFSLITAYLNYSLSGLILRQMGYGIISIPGLSRFKLPSNIIGGFAIMFIVSFLIRSFEFIYYNTIILNIVVLGISAFLLQGLAVFNHFLVKRKTRPLVRFLMILVFFTIFFPLAWVFPILGLLDAIFDFRKSKKA